MSDEFKPRLSLEASREKEVTEKKTSVVHRTTREREHISSDVANDIVAHLVDADDELKLLQLTPISKGEKFDIAFDIVQRDVMDEERIGKRIPLSKRFMEAYLRGTRGADADLSHSLMDMARSQVESKLDTEFADDKER
jgi:hypothetical protein